MKQIGRLLVLAALAVALPRPAAAQRGTLDIYFIDVEGGQSTLVVTPAGQSLLIDAGYPGFNARDPDRIVAAVRDANRIPPPRERPSQIDYSSSRTITPTTSALFRSSRS